MLINSINLNNVKWFKMYNWTIKITVFSLLTLFFYSLAYSQNPIIQTNYTADPAPMVHNDTVFLYTTHDEDETVNNFFTMNDWKCYSSVDMVNWTDHGTVLSYTDFKWARGDAWAGQCIYRNGKYYFYVPVNQKNGGNAIGVGVSDSPTGPFSDAIGSPLTTGLGYIDPTVFIDDDDQAYLFWGNPDLYYVKLNEDMISFDETTGVVQVPLTVESFGPRENNEDRLTSYEEGPWLYKRNDLYYLLYPAGGVPEHLAYSTSTSLTGTWEYQDTIMHVIADRGAFTNHPGLIDYMGRTFLFYHNAALPGGGGFKRSVCVDEFTFNEDGSIPLITPTKTGVVKSVSNLNPYQWNQAETIAWQEGIETERDSKIGMYVTDINNNDYIKVRSVDFGQNGACAFIASISLGAKSGISKGGEIEIYQDENNGTFIGSVPVSYTGGNEIWMDEIAYIKGDTGVHDLCFVFNGAGSEDFFNFDKWQFIEKSNTHDLYAINAFVDSYKLDTLTGYNETNIFVLAIYTDGSSEDITLETSFDYDQEDILSITDSTVKGINYGEVTVQANYNGKTDEVKLIIKNLESELAVNHVHVSNSTVELLTGSSTTVEISAEYYDGHMEIVTDKVSFDNPGPGVATISSQGIISAKSEGEINIEVSYKGELGDSKSTIITVKVTNRSPYIKNEIEDYSDQSGIQTESCNDTGGGLNVGFIENGDWVKFDGLDFGDGASFFEARVSSASSGGKIELRLDSPTGKLIGTCNVSGTGGWQSWETKSCNVSGVSGLHNLYLVFTGSGGFLLNINWWKFTEQTTSTSKYILKKTPVIIVNDNNNVYLTGINKGDNIIVYNCLGQKIKSFIATSEQEYINRFQGVLVIEVKNDVQRLFLKTVL